VRERRALACLSVFARGCTADAAHEVCGADLDTLESLVDKSLVHHQDGRYSMLEVLREFAAEVLETGGASRRWGSRRRYTQAALPGG